MRRAFQRVWRRTGARVLMLQAAALILALAVTGLLAGLSVRGVSEQAYRTEVMGEIASLNDEQRQKGLDHLPHTVAKRSRLWHGFEYGLAGRGGRYLAGDLRLSRLAADGWTTADGAKGPVLAFTERLPDGGSLTVGRDLSPVRLQMRQLTALLALSGVVGLAICLATTYLMTRWVWRRHAQLSATSALVAAGRLDVRAPVRAAAAPDEIDELSIALNAMLDQIGRLVEQLRRVSLDVAHDMRRPLTRLRHKLERLARTADGSPAVAAEVARLDADFQEILRTFDALLQLAEIEASPRPGTPVDLAELAERVCDALRPDIEESGRRLEVRLRPAQVSGDAALVSQALANLLENALRHTPAGARIEVRVEDAGQGPRLSVRDDGPGIPAALHEAALAPFGRLEASRSTPGSGLGLAITASVAARHGARLELADAGPGLAVSMAFPPA